MTRRESENLNFDSEEDQLNSSKNSEYKKPMSGERDIDSSKTKLEDIQLGEELTQAEEMNQNLLMNHDSESSATGENPNDSTTIVTAATVSASFKPNTSDNRKSTDIGLAADDTAMDNLGTPCLETPPTNKYTVTKFNTGSLSVNL